MAIKISEATDVVTPLGSDCVPLERPGNTTAYKLTVQEIADFVEGTIAPMTAVSVGLNGSTIGARPEINFLEGSGANLSVSDNAGSNRVDVTVSIDTASLPAGSVPDPTGHTGQFLRTSDGVAYDWEEMTISKVTNLQTSLDGKSATSHNHTGTYQPLATVLTNTTASFTTAQESKLSGIAAGAEVNVNADWSASSGDAQILNKPTLGTASAANLGTGASDAAYGNHLHTADYQPLNSNLTSLGAISTSQLGALTDITMQGLATLSTSQVDALTDTAFPVKLDSPIRTYTLAKLGNSPLLAEANWSHRDCSRVIKIGSTYHIWTSRSPDHDLWANTASATIAHWTASDIEGPWTMGNTSTIAGSGIHGSFDRYAVYNCSAWIEGSYIYMMYNGSCTPPVTATTAWVTGTAYAVNDYRLNSGSTYRCDIAHTSGTFATDLAAGKWVLIPTIDAWTTSTSYVAWDFVLHSGTPYRCITNHTSGTFATDLAAGRWEEQPVGVAQGLLWSAGGLGLARTSTSTPDATFTRLTPLLEGGDESAWDWKYDGVDEPVKYNDNTWRIYYKGAAHPPAHDTLLNAQFGFIQASASATFPTSPGSWSKFSGNPVFGLNNSGSWPYKCEDPHVFVMDGIHYICASAIQSSGSAWPEQLVWYKSATGYDNWTRAHEIEGFLMGGPSSFATGLGYLPMIWNNDLAYMIYEGTPDGYTELDMYLYKYIRNGNPPTLLDSIPAMLGDTDTNYHLADVFDSSVVVNGTGTTAAIPLGTTAATIPFIDTSGHLHSPYLSDGTTTKTVTELYNAAAGGGIPATGTNYKIDDTNNVYGFGTAVPEAFIHWVEQEDVSSKEFLHDSYDATGSRSASHIFRKARGNPSSKTCVRAGDTLGSYVFRGAYNTTSTSDTANTAFPSVASARIIVKASADFDQSSNPNEASITFDTADGSSASATTRLYIGHDGKIGIGNYSYTSPPANLLTVDGTVECDGFKLTDGNQSLNKVLTCDANGVGTWQTAASGVSVYDEATELTTAATRLTFTGAGVTATEPTADQITVTVPGFQFDSTVRVTTNQTLASTDCGKFYYSEGTSLSHTLPEAIQTDVGKIIAFYNTSATACTINKHANNTYIVYNGAESTSISLAQYECVVLMSAYIVGATNYRWICIGRDYLRPEVHAAVTNEFLTGLGTDGIFTHARPSMANISDLPTLASGTYTPTATSVANLDSTPTPQAAQYLRVGNVVTVSGSVTVDPTAAGNTTWRLTLPIASNLTADNECAGIVSSNGALGAASVGIVRADSTNDAAFFGFYAGYASLASTTLFYTYTYQIL